jgi:hypothetical protein
VLGIVAALVAVALTAVLFLGGYPLFAVAVFAFGAFGLWAVTRSSYTGKRR